MSNFRKMTPQWLQNGCPKNFKLLKHEQSGDFEYVITFANHLNFAIQWETESSHWVQSSKRELLELSVKIKAKN